MNIKRLLILTGTVLLGVTLVSLWLLFLSGQPGLARAASFTVCPAGPPTCDYSSIQSAVDAAADGDEIKVAEGTYTGINNRGGLAQVVYIDKSVTIHGGYTTSFSEPPDPVANPTTLDAQEGGRVLFITGNISPTIEGLRITGGDATVLGSDEDGGGVYIVFATATFTDNQVFGNTAQVGGGFFLDQSAATLSHNTIISNVANSGGGLWMWQCDNITLNENTISFNTVYTNAGGLWSGGVSDNIIFTGNTFSNNHSGDWAGGLELQGEGYSLIGNTIISNTAIRDGGLFLLNGDFTLTGNTISYNKAEGNGGLFLWYSSARLIGNEISRNSAENGGGVGIGNSNALLIDNIISINSADYGGGLSIGDANATLSYNTIISNTASHQGGGVYINGKGTALNGNTLSGNSAHEGGGLLLLESDSTLTNNMIFENQADFGSGLAIGASSPNLVHNTIARNTGGSAMGVYISSGNVSMTNTILVSHTVGISVEPGSSATLESTLWYGNDANWSGGGTINNSNDHTGNPDFLDYEAGDYHIGSNSDAIDAGVEADVTRDIDNQPRPYQTPDIGADEYWPPGVLKYLYLPLVTR